MRIGARKRLEKFLDPDNQQEIGTNLKPVDALKFKDSKKYKDRSAVGAKSTLVKMMRLIVSQW